MHFAQNKNIMKNLTITFVLILSQGFLIAQTEDACLPQGITFNTQAQIDNFPTNYPNCTEIEGNVTIWGTDITNLNGLEGLTSIGGSLTIMGSPCLKSLNGLNNLITIGFSCDISYNDSLTSLTGLESLTSIALFLKIWRNEVLTNMQGLDNLNYIGSNLNVHGNSSLTSFEGLENLASVVGLEIIGNYALTSLSGLENLTYIGWYTKIKHNSSLSICEEQWLCNYLSDPGGYVDIYNNAVGCNSVVELANACGGSIPCLPYGNYVLSSQSDIDNFQLAFPNCAELEGDVIINGSDITNLYGLNLLVSIEGDLNILENSALMSCVGLEGLTSIGGDMEIGDYTAGNPILASLTGLEGLTSIGGNLYVCYNDSLTSFMGLNNLTSIGGYLRISGNDALTSLTGLDLIEAGSITNLNITENYFLSECHVLSVCNYLANPNGAIEIHDNSEGCNDTVQVNAACLGVSIEEIMDEHDFVISPNPINGFATLNYNTDQKGTATIGIYNTLGNCLQSRQIKLDKAGQQHLALDFTGFASGIYFCRVQLGSEVVVKKIIKN
jgi:hypothetical protein